MCLSPFFILALPQLHSVCQGCAWLFLGLSEHIGAMSGSSLASRRLLELWLAFAQSHSACQGYLMPLPCGQYAALLCLCCAVVCYAVAHIDWYRYVSPSPYIAVPGPVQLCRLPCQAMYRYVLPMLHQTIHRHRTTRHWPVSLCRCRTSQNHAVAMNNLA